MFALANVALYSTVASAAQFDPSSVSCVVFLSLSFRAWLLVSYLRGTCATPNGLDVWSEQSWEVPHLPGAAAPILHRRYPDRGAWNPRTGARGLMLTPPFPSAGKAYQRANVESFFSPDSNFNITTSWHWPSFGVTSSSSLAPILPSLPRRPDKAPNLPGSMLPTKSGQASA